MRRLTEAFTAASLGSLVPFALLPGLQTVGSWTDLYFTLLTVQCGGILIFLNALAARPGRPVPSKSRLAMALVVLSAGFVVMGMLDGILGVYGSCPAACPELIAGFFLALVAVFGLEISALRLATGTAQTPRNRIFLAGLSSLTMLLGVLGYWAFGWSLFFPIDVDTMVLLYKVGPVSLSLAGGDLIEAIALTPLAHAGVAFLSLRSMRRVPSTKSWNRRPYLR